MDQPVESDFLSIAELGEWLGCSRSKSYEMVQPGPNSIPAYRIGRRIIVRRSEVESWLEENRFAPEV